jgi:hypothetical protein
MPQAISAFVHACEFGTEWLILFDTQVVIEKWTATGVKPHREIIGYGQRYYAKLWSATLRASNSIPLCGVIHPGCFVRQVACEYVYDFDLSEDFVFHIMCFAHPNRPSIKVIEELCAHQSHRTGEDNVSNVEDRTGWAAETGNGLYQLLFQRGRTFEVISAGETNAGEVSVRERIEFLEAEITRLNIEAGRLGKARTQAIELLAELIKRTIGTAP